MDKSVFAIDQHTQKDKSIIASCMQVQDIPVLFGQFHRIAGAEYHSWVVIQQRKGEMVQLEVAYKRWHFDLVLLRCKFIIIWGMSDFDYLLKFIVVGDTGVGKSCVVTQFIEQKINENHQITLGVEFASRNLLLGNKTLKLQVWDTAGQENFRSITRSYYRSAIGALLIYDITKKRSFEHLQDWIKEIKTNGSDQLQILLIGNKNDLDSAREVDAAEGRTFAQENNIQWLEISAKDYAKVENAFLKLARLIVSRIERGDINEFTPGIKIGRSSKIDPLADYGGPKKKYCC